MRTFETRPLYLRGKRPPTSEIRGNMGPGAGPNYWETIKSLTAAGNRNTVPLFLSQYYKILHSEKLHNLCILLNPDIVICEEGYDGRCVWHALKEMKYQQSTSARSHLEDVISICDAIEFGGIVTKFMWLSLESITKLPYKVMNFRFS
jgi:hypothetical protein